MGDSEGVGGGMLGLITRVLWGTVEVNYMVWDGVLRLITTKYEVNC